MGKLTKIITVYFFCILFSMIGVTLYHNYLLNNEIIPLETVIGISLTKNTELPREKIFAVMADIENYPNILPNNIIYVNIINQTEVKGNSTKIIFAEEKVSERGVITTLTVKHEITSPHGHKIEIMDGDAKGTTIKLKFESVENGTKLSSEAIIHIKGILAPFGFLTTPNLESALNSALDAFIEYAK